MSAATEKVIYLRYTLSISSCVVEILNLLIRFISFSCEAFRSVLVVSNERRALIKRTVHMTKLLLSLSCAAALVAAASASEAMPIASDAAGVSGAPIILAAQGCGYGWYRGPGGYCHRFGYGPYPGGYWGVYQGNWNGCPPGYWRGPWGHCRNTPYHGRLPGGGWK